MKRSIWPGLRLGRVLLVVLAAAGSLSAWQPARAGSFQMFPGRLVFDGRGGVQTVTVINSEREPVTVTTALADYTMTPDGGLANLDAIGQRADLREIAARVRSARQALTVAPQRTAVAAQGFHVIRVRADTSALPPGEYRSHLRITSLPVMDDGVGSSDEVAENQPVTDLKIALTMTMPVIVRIGPRDARADLIRPRLTSVDASSAAGGAVEKAPALEIDLVRRGSSSVYGTVEVRSASAGKKDPPLGQIRGTAVYPEVESRSVTVNLKRAPQSGERLLISFWDQEKVAKKPLAQVEFQVP